MAACMSASRLESERGPGLVDVADAEADAGRTQEDEGARAPGLADCTVFWVFLQRNASTYFLNPTRPCGRWRRSDARVSRL